MQVKIQNVLLQKGVTATSTCRNHENSHPPYESKSFRKSQVVCQETKQMRQFGASGGELGSVTIITIIGAATREESKRRGERGAIGTKR